MNSMFTQAIIDTLPGVFALFDVQGRLLRWNHQFETVSGYAADAIRDMTVFDFFRPADVPRIVASFERLARESSSTIEADLMTKSGETIPYLLSGRVLNYPGGPYIVGIGSDITVRKRAEDEARRAEALVRLLLDSTVEGIYGVDLDGRCTMANQASARLLGYRGVESLLGHNMHDLIHHTRPNGERYPASDCPGVAALRAGDAAHAPDELLWRADGTSFPAEYWAYPMRRDGQLVGSVVTFFDISARRAADAKLRLQVTALNAAANALVITDRRGAIVWANQAFSALTGYDIPEALGRNPRELLKSGAHDRAFYEAMWQTITSGRVWNGQLTNRRKDGTRYLEQMVITPVASDAGEITHFIAIKRDLTDEKRVEAQLLQSQKMEVVGRLAGGIAHDFNNLLNIINGTAELAAMDLAEDQPLFADLQQIREAGSRAAALTRQLLAFSRKQVIKLELLNLNAVFDQLAPVLRRAVGDDVTLVLAPNSGLGFVKADTDQMEQLILNLLLNARDAMPSGGSVTISLENITLPAASGANGIGGEAIRLRVTDTGVGMDEATMGRIFEPFFTTKGRDKASGLGLATVHGIVTHAGGAIAVTSAPGQGSTFTIDLPRVDAAPVVRVRPGDVSAPGTEAVLVVEDEPGVRRTAERVLQSAGYLVLDAGSGADALALLSRPQVDITAMLCDVVMPVMGGVELVEKARQLRPGLKVLFMSGHTDDVVLRERIREGRAEFIAKPFSKADLIRKIRAVIDETAMAIQP